MFTTIALSKDMVGFFFFIFLNSNTVGYLSPSESSTFHVAYCSFCRVDSVFGFSCRWRFPYMNFWEYGLCWPYKDASLSHMFCRHVSRFVCLGCPEEALTEGNALEATGHRLKPCGYYGLHRKGPVDLEKYKSD